MVQQAHHDNHAHDDTANFIPSSSRDELQVTLKIYDILSKKVATLVNEYQ